MAKQSLDMMTRNEIKKSLDSSVVVRLSQGRGFEANIQETKIVLIKVTTLSTIQRCSKTKVSTRD